MSKTYSRSDISAKFLTGTYAISQTVLNFCCTEKTTINLLCVNFEKFRYTQKYLATFFRTNKTRFILSNAFEANCVGRITNVCATIQQWHAYSSIVIVIISPNDHFHVQSDRKYALSAKPTLKAKFKFETGERAYGEILAYTSIYLARSDRYFSRHLARLIFIFSVGRYVSITRPRRNIKTAFYYDFFSNKVGSVH